MIRFFGATWMVLLVALSLGAARAETGPWQGNDYFKVRLISASAATGTAATLDAGLEFKLEDGWKVYWRSPGDAGLPPELDFTTSVAVTGHRLRFPAPERFSILGFDSYGYGDAVILPLELSLASPGRALVASAELIGLVCKDICIPVQETLTLAVGRGEAVPSAQARRIAEYRALVPSDGTAAGVEITAAAVAGETLSLRLDRAGSPLARLDGDIFIEAGSGYGFAAPAMRQGMASIEVTGKPAEDLIGETVTITVVGSDFLLEQPVTVSAGRLAPDGYLPQLLLMLAAGLLGGLILNAMPCVLPVLSLKLSSVVSHGGGEAAAIRRSFVATAAGVITSFLLLGLGLLLVRSAGIAVGWGIQFQQPVFLIGAALAIAFFGLVMLDRVILPVPAALQGITLPSGLAGDFASGALATLLATPCSAPFVGTAIAFALAAPAGELMAVFAAMGTGLALPWILVALRPGMVQLLPKPGPWLIWLKRLLAVGLFGTAFWLLTVLASHFTADHEVEGNWQAWRPGLAQQLAAEGRVVFVDVTADWCITCQTNKAFVVETEAVSAAFQSADAVLLKADWTRPDATISQYLASHGRYGIPFNAVYGPAALEGLPLPEILTTGTVLEALDRAAD